MKMITALPIGRERTEEEKRRRHLHGDKGATFSKGKQLCLLTNGVSGCVTTFATKDNLVAEFYDTLIYNNMKQKKTTLNLPPELRDKKFRIRKLTPRECFRLMAVSDADIDTIQASGLSNSAQYKLAGNSICAGGNHTDANGNVDGVLYNLFRKMFIETEPDIDTSQPMQLSLF